MAVTMIIMTIIQSSRNGHKQAVLNPHCLKTLSRLLALVSIPLAFRDPAIPLRKFLFQQL